MQMNKKLQTLFCLEDMRFKKILQNKTPINNVMSQDRRSSSIKNVISNMI